ncbi:hypothetical protein TNCV_1530411 [Trichonephila clavipes]|uniref:Uncharacterized protein n=1 Tax=Trichonephila clavipes TaxID=2585209 RepID=A0A8X6RC81_TRICX|nr:hypothetical protein TNCV_1530411 [Trichonephila clavipes]
MERLAKILFQYNKYLFHILRVCSFIVLILLLYLDEAKCDFRARPGFEPGPLAPKARIIPLDHRAVSYQPDPSTKKRCQEECNYNSSMDVKHSGLDLELNPGPLAPKARIIPLDHRAVKDTRGTVKCSLRNGLAQWAGPGIEPVASRTLSENHTPRPPSLVKERLAKMLFQYNIYLFHILRVCKFMVLILLLYLDEAKCDFRARPGFEPGPLAPKARIIPLDHRAVSYQPDPSTKKRCQEECNYNSSMDVKHGGFDRKLKREPLAPEARNIPLDHGARVIGGIFSFIAFNILVREFLKLQLVIRIVCVIKEPFPLNT